MKFEQLTSEQAERAKGCKTDEERRAFLEDIGIELTDEQIEGIAGGRKKNLSPSSKCPANDDKGHKYVYTGRTRPGSIFGDWWPDKEKRCEYCGDTYWT
jgi:hypothetical protein